MEIKNTRRNSPVKNYPSDDDLYLDVFKGKEKEKPKINTNLQQSDQNIMPRSYQSTIPTSNPLRLAPGQKNITTIDSLNRGGMFPSQQLQEQQPQKQQQQLQQPEQAYTTQTSQGQKSKPSHHERDYQPSSSSDSETDQDEQSKHKPRKRKSSDRNEVVVRSNAAKNLIKDFYAEEELAVVAPGEGTVT
jgi:hypothetical protein